MNFFTADQHFGHYNVYKTYCMRPFESLNKMDTALIQNWNRVVDKTDTVYVLGDMTMRGPEDILWFRVNTKKLNGKKVLILGNHDKLNPFQYIEVGFQSVHTSLILGEYVLIHDNAGLSLSCTDKKILCGHVHQNWTKIKNSLNVGVDVHNYKPISEVEVEDFFNIKGHII